MSFSIVFNCLSMIWSSFYSIFEEIQWFSRIIFKSYVVIKEDSSMVVRWRADEMEIWCSKIRRMGRSFQPIFWRAAFQMRADVIMLKDALMLTRSFLLFRFYSRHATPIHPILNNTIKIYSHLHCITLRKLKNRNEHTIHLFKGPSLSKYKWNVGTQIFA